MNIMIYLNEAQDIARREVEKIVDGDPGLSRSEVEDVKLARETKAAWVFTADIPKLINDGWSPGAISVFIDKNDGHILSVEEQSAFHKSWEKTRRRAGFIR